MFVVDWALALAALLLFAAVAFLSWPRPPELEGERWFKLSLATLLLGEITERSGTEAEWLQALKGAVLYHPLGRFPERKLLHSAVASFPSGFLQGEKRLVQQLAKRPDLPSRRRWMYEECEVGQEHRLADPVELGPDYDPSTYVGKDWEELSKWGAGGGSFAQALAQRSRLTWIFVGEQTPLGTALAAMVPKSLCVDNTEEALVEATDGVQSVVWFAEGDEGLTLLEHLVARLDLKDRTHAAVFAGAPIMGRTDVEVEDSRSIDKRKDWMQRWFRQVDLEPELVRLVPYFCFQWVDERPTEFGVPGVPVQSARLPEPSEEGSVVTTIEVVDLGPIPVEAPIDQVSKALWWVVSAWVMARS